MTAKNSGIYMIKNVKNGKFYVGSALNINVRWQSHISRMRVQTHANAHLQNAWKKYGAGAFKFIVLEYVDDPHALIVREQHWMDITNAATIGYNLCPVAGSALGRKMSEETKLKIGASNKNKVRTREHMEKIASKLRGRPISEETKAKLSKILSGRVMSREAVAKGVAARRKLFMERVESDEFFSEENKVKRALSQLSKKIGTNNTSGIKGVRKCNRSTEKSPAWTAEIWHRNKKIYIGRFKSMELAVQAREARLAEVHKSLAEGQRW